MTNDIILQAKGLKKYYGKGETMARALDGVDLAIQRGKFTAIIGTSGSGKSTLLNMLGGLDTPTEGSIQVGGTDLTQFTGEQATIFRRKKIGFVFQNYNLIPVLTVWENIVFPLTLGRAEARPGLHHGGRPPPGPGAQAGQPAGEPLRRPAAAGGHRPGLGFQTCYPTGR